MGNMEVTRSELMKNVHIKDIVSFRVNYLNPTIKTGYVEMTLPEKPRSKNQKYRLTKKSVSFKKKVKG